MIAVATAFLIFFFRQNTESFPRELIEAARIDGVGEFGIFTRIFMPTMKSTYAAAIIVTFMSSWNNYLWPLIALQSPENYYSKGRGGKPQKLCTYQSGALWQSVRNPD